MTVYEQITQKLLDRIEEAERTGEKFRWVKGWTGGPICAVEYVTGRPYSGCNAITLDAGEYITWNRLCDYKKTISEEEAKNIYVKKGCHKVPVYYWFHQDEKDKDGNIVYDDEGNPKQIFYMKKHLVFMREDIQGLPSKFPAKKVNHTPVKHEKQLQKFIQTFIEETNLDVDIVEDGTKAYYRSDTHTIRVPRKDGFKSSYAYYQVLLHELCHSTAKALGRSLDGTFGDVSYSKEELIAEIGSQMILQRMGIVDDDTEENSIAYLQNWAQHLRANKRELAVAASQAEKVAQYFFEAAGKEKEKDHDIHR